ncbi:MAG: hypothetical protein HYU28_01975 [Actinobacteria bacterium]|nr:hypothetical protein [Actinomycetota bacterium]
MIRTALVAAVLVLATATAGPAVAAETVVGAARPWHYWIAPFLLGGGVLLLAVFGVGYYVRVMGGRGRR